MSPHIRSREQEYEQLVNDIDEVAAETSLALQNTGWISHGHKRVRSSTKGRRTWYGRQLYRDTYTWTNCANVTSNLWLGEHGLLYREFDDMLELVLLKQLRLSNEDLVTLRAQIQALLPSA